LSSLKQYKDRLFYGWIVVASFFLIGITLWGIRFSFGVFFKPLASEFTLTRTTTSLIFAAYMILCGVFTIVTGWALDRYGPKRVLFLMGLFTGLGLILTGQTTEFWHVFLTYSLLLAIGTSGTYVVVMSTVSRWFKKKRGLATGISGAGAGLGPMIMAPGATLLITSFDWRIAFIVIGGVIWLVILPLSRLLKKDPREIGVLPDGIKTDADNSPVPKLKNQEHAVTPTDLSLRQAISTRSFRFVIANWVFFAAILFLITTHLVPHITDMGFSAEEAAGVLSLLGGTATVSRVLIGGFSDKFGRKLTAISCILFMALTIVWLIWSRELWMFYVFAFFFGFAYGGVGPSVASLIGDTFGLTNMGTIMGVLDVGFSGGAAAGPVIGGLIFDTTGSYFVAFVLGAVFMTVAALLITPVRRETAE